MQTASRSDWCGANWERDKRRICLKRRHLSGEVVRRRCNRVEIAHGWFKRFRKLLARYEKLYLCFVALNRLAAVIVKFIKVKFSRSVING